MAHPFDVGYTAEPFLTLCASNPDETVYPPEQFSGGVGPILHRGRLDGSAHVLVIGHDPAQYETVSRRILVGEAGRRLQGFLAKLGIATSYVSIKLKAQRSRDTALFAVEARGFLNAPVGEGQAP